MKSWKWQRVVHTPCYGKLHSQEGRNVSFCWSVGPPPSRRNRLQSSTILCRAKLDSGAMGDERLGSGCQCHILDVATRLDYLSFSTRYGRNRYNAEELEKRGVPPSRVFKLHSDLDQKTIDAATAKTDFTRIVLSTSIAETSIIIPDVDHVIDYALCRKTRKEGDPLPVEDYSAPWSVRNQRAGRMGRTKPGGYTSIERQLAESDLSSTRNDQDSLLRAIAFEKFHCKVRVNELQDRFDLVIWMELN